MVRVPFRVVSSNAFPETASDTLVEVDMALANLGARAVAIGSTFEFFRFESLRAYQYTNIVGPVFNTVPTTGIQGHLNADHYLGFIESNAQLSGSATTRNQVSQYELFKSGRTDSTLKLSVPKDVLRANALKWYNTASTGASSDALSPGLWVSGVENMRSVLSGWTGLAIIVIEGVLQFRGMITPALTFSDTISAIPTRLEDSKEEFVLCRVEKKDLKSKS
jgi:hypothetical protein